MTCTKSPTASKTSESMEMQMGLMVFPAEFLDEGEFLFMNEDGQFSKTILKKGEIVAYGRCPSEGKDSALSIVVRCMNGDFSLKVPLDVCKMYNIDFDSNKAWILRTGLPDSAKELKEAWKRL